MPEVRYIDHAGKQILLIDLSHSDGGVGIAQAAEEAMQIVRSTGKPHIVLGLLDFSGTSLNRTVRETMKKMSANNGPYMKAVAFVGLGAVLSAVFRGVLLLTKRKNHRVFGTRGDALDWLAGEHPSG